MRHKLCFADNFFAYKVIEIGANYIVGVKNVTSNEPFFQGHFPQEPVMPGVLQIEAMAQTGGLLVLNSVDEPERYSTYFMKIDGVKFRQKVVPGDTLIFRVELMAPIRRGISTMKGYLRFTIENTCDLLYIRFYPNVIILTSNLNRKS